MEYPIGDFLDRFAITILKVKFLGDEAREEHDALNEEYLRLCKEHPEWELHSRLSALIRINKKIWGFEADLRRGQLEDYPIVELTGVTRESLLQLAAVGMSAIRIRNANRERTAIRNELVEKTGFGWADVKINHSGEDIKIDGVELT